MPRDTPKNPRKFEGMRFHMLVAIHRINGRRAKWECACDCGNTRAVFERALEEGTVKSCGCANKFKKAPIKNRLMEKVIVDQETGCWNWTGSKTKKGYGKTHYDGSQTSAHRASYLVFKGNIEHGMCVCHKCDNPSCINPDHLFKGDQQDNLRDMRNKGRSRYGVTVGAMNNKSKLNNDLVAYIRSCHKTNSELALELGVQWKTVSYAKRGKTWKHIPGATS